MNYTQVRITAEYLERLRKLAGANKRSMLKQLEILIDEAVAEQVEAEKRQLLEKIIGGETSLTDVYGDDWRNNYGYNETQVRDAARYLQRKQRNRIDTELAKLRRKEGR